MARIAYEDWNPSPNSRAIVRIADEICAEYAAVGYDLTLRQLYYQFVARDLIPNTQRSYDNLGATIDRARKAGLLDWDYIVDRTRNLRGETRWGTPERIIQGAADSYHLDHWTGNPNRVEVWVEKEALAGIVQRAAESLDCDYFSCRGYVSQSEMHSAAQRIRRRARFDDQETVILHLGDHDPSGLDMTRDIQDRLAGFGATVRVDRIALNWDQIEEFSPPPNPAKLTDSRAKGYVAEFGFESWELDSLDPATLDQLIRDQVAEYLWEPELFDAIHERQERERVELRQAAESWAEHVRPLLVQLGEES